MIKISDKFNQVNISRKDSRKYRAIRLLSLICMLIIVFQVGIFTLNNLLNIYADDIAWDTDADGNGTSDWIEAFTHIDTPATSSTTISGLVDNTRYQNIDMFNKAKINGVNYTNVLYQSKHGQPNLMGIFENSNITSFNGHDFDVSSINTLQSTFEGCTYLESVDISNWDTANVIYFDYMFRNCISLTDVNITNLDLTNCDSFKSVFIGCTALESVNLGNINFEDFLSGICSDTGYIYREYDNRSDTEPEVTFEGLFKNCTNLKTLYFGEDFKGFGCTYVEDYYVAEDDEDEDYIYPTNLFYIDSPTLVELDIVIPGTKELDNTYLKTFYLYDWAKDNRYINLYKDSVSESKLLFSNKDEASDITWYSNRNGDETSDWIEAFNIVRYENDDPATHIVRELSLKDSDAYQDINMFNKAYYEGTLLTLDLDTITDDDTYNTIFENSNITSFNSHDLDTSHVDELCNMFSGCKHLTSVNLGPEFVFIDSASSMFYGCTSLNTINTSEWDVSGLNDAINMFLECTSLTTLDLSNWDTRNLTYTDYMFYGCTSLTNITGISDLNTSNIESFTSMFEECTSLTNIDTTKWTLKNGVDLEDIFEGCTNIETLDLSNLLTSSTFRTYYIQRNYSSATSETPTNTYESMAFANCDNLTTIIFGENLDFGHGHIYEIVPGRPKIEMRDEDIDPIKLFYVDTLAPLNTNIIIPDSKAEDNTYLNKIKNYDWASDNRTINIYKGSIEDANLLYSTYTPTLTIESEDEDKGTVSGSSGTFNVGDSVTITASPLEGYGFCGWYDGDEKISSDLSYTFNISNKDITLTAKFNLITLTVTGTYTYKNAQIIPTIEVKNGDTLLTVSDDYTALYGTNIHAGTNAGSVTVTLKGNYSGTLSKNFDIKKLDVDIELEMYMTENFTMEYSGSRLPDPISVSCNIKDENSNEIDKVTYSFKRLFANRTVGNNKDIAHFLLNTAFTNGTTLDDINYKTFKITTHKGTTDYLDSINSASKTANVLAIGKITPKTITYTYAGDKSYDGNSNASVTFTLNEDDICTNTEGGNAKDVVTLLSSTLTGKYKDDGVQVSSQGEHDIILDDGMLLTLDGADKNNYTIVQPTSLRGNIIAPSINSADIIETVHDVTYTGIEAIPNFTLTRNSINLIPLSDYTVTCSSINCGSATATITGINNYSGTRAITFNILPYEVNVNLTDTSLESTLKQTKECDGNTNGLEKTVTVNGVHNEKINVKLTSKYSSSNEGTCDLIYKVKEVSMNGSSNTLGTNNYTITYNPALNMQNEITLLNYGTITKKVNRPEEPSHSEPKTSNTSTITVQTVSSENNHASYINGYKDGTFKPNNKITRAETATMLARLSDTFSTLKDYSSLIKDRYTDIKQDSNDWYTSYVGFITAKGIMGGYSDGSFKPNSTITRAEFAAAIIAFKGLRLIKNDEQVFSDYKDKWYKDIVDTLVYYGYIKGYNDKTFRGDNAITRAEAVTIINGVLNRSIYDNPNNNTYNKFSDVEKGKWYYNDILEATNSHYSNK